MQNLIQTVMKKWGFTTTRYVTNRETLLLSTSAMMAMLLVGCDSDSSDDDTNVEVDNNSDNGNELITINAVAVDYNQEPSISIDDYVNITGIHYSATAGISHDYYLFAPNSIFNDDGGPPDPNKIDSDEVFFLVPVISEEPIEVLYQSGFEEEELSEVVFNFKDGHTQIVISIPAADDEDDEVDEDDNNDQSDPDSIEIVSEDEHEFDYLDVAEMNEGEIFYVQAKSTADNLTITFSDLDGATVYHGDEVVQENEVYTMALDSGTHTIEFNFVEKTIDYSPQKFHEGKTVVLEYSISNGNDAVNSSLAIEIDRIAYADIDQEAMVLNHRYHEEESSREPNENLTGRFISLDDVVYDTDSTSIANHCLAFLFASTDEDENEKTTTDGAGYQYSVYWLYPSDNAPSTGAICDQVNWYPPDTQNSFIFYDDEQYDHYYIGRTNDGNALLYDYYHDKFIAVDDESAF